MDTKRVLFCILWKSLLKQHVDSCFQYLSDEEEQRKSYKTIQHIFGKKKNSYDQPTSLSASHDVKWATHVPIFEHTITATISQLVCFDALHIHITSIWRRWCPKQAWLLQLSLVLVGKII